MKHFENIVNFPIITLIRHLWIEIALRSRIQSQRCIPSQVPSLSVPSTSCIYFLAFPLLSSPNLQDKEFTLLFLLLLIRPGSQVLILAWVKTLSPLRSGDSSFSLVACRRQQQWWNCFFQSVTSLTHWNKDNVELFVLRCNYADLLTFSLSHSFSLPFPFAILIRSASTQTLTMWTCGFWLMNQAPTHPSLHIWIWVVCVSGKRKEIGKGR